MDRFLTKTDTGLEGSLVNVGAWYRNPWTIFTVDSPIPKRSLKGTAMDNYFKPENLVITKEKIDNIIIHNKWEHYLYDHIVNNNYLIEEFGLTKDDVPKEFSFELDQSSSDESIYVTKLREYINKMLSSVEILEKLPNKEFDDLLAKNVIFLDLVDCSAANTIIECIVRATPLLINRSEPACEYLGENYPLFYDNKADISSLLTIERIKSAHQYLLSLNKDFLSIDVFLESFSKQIYPLLKK